MAEQESLHLPEEWERAIERARDARRIAVIGPTDVGKSSFTRALAARWRRSERLGILDLDPGQKMVGPPGAVALGRFDAREAEAVCEKFVFIGTTSSIAIRQIVDAARTLAREEPLVANSSGFVAGPGARLQPASIAAVAADFIVAIGYDAPALPKGWAGPVIHLQPSPFATRKTPPMRARIRQAALERYLGPALTVLDRRAVTFAPGPARLWESAHRPLCSLADAEGADMVIGIVEAADAGTITVRSAPPPRPVSAVRLGKIWVEPADEGWRLLEVLAPAWEG